MTRRRRVLLVIGGVLGAFVLWEAVTSYVAYTDDAYVRSDLIGVAAQVTGQIVAVHVHDNQTVAAGDPLISLDPVPFQLAVAQRQAQVNEANAQLRADQDAIAGAQDAVVSADAALLLTQETLRRVVSLARTADTPAQRVDEATEAEHSAAASLESARATLARAQALSALHQAGLAAAEAATETARWQLARTQVVAPAAGIVNNLTVRVGDTAQADVPLIGIVDAGAWRIIANYKQDYIRAFLPGGTAWVWLDSQPWHLHRARVEGIARGISRDPSGERLLPYVAPTTDWIRLQRRFPVTLRLVDAPPDLTLFMGADARVVIFP